LIVESESPVLLIESTTTSEFIDVVTPAVPVRRSSPDFR
jgi:hypothetical protein